MSDVQEVTTAERIEATIDGAIHRVAREVQAAIEHIERLDREAGNDTMASTGDMTPALVELFERLNAIVENGPAETLAEYEG